MILLSAFSILLLAIASSSGREKRQEDKDVISDISDTVPRGVQVRLTQSGLNLIAKIETEHLQEVLEDLKIPDERGGGNHFEYAISDIQIKKFSVKNQVMRTTPGN